MHIMCAVSISQGGKKTIQIGEVFSMNYSKFISEEHQKILHRARATYGHKKQLSVAAEELDELAILCNKYQRYDKHKDAVKDLHEKVLGEVADVLIVLDHLIAAFGVKEYELKSMVSGKVARLEGWLNESSSLQVSTVMRDIPNDTCTESHSTKEGQY